MPTRRNTPIMISALALITLTPIAPAFSHHAANVYFDVSTVIELRGVITDVKWQNPHIGFSLNVIDSNGEPTTWMIESNSVSTLRQLGITADQIIIGEVVTVAGWPARAGGNRMSGNHLLLPDGQELVLRGSGDKHFTAGRDNRHTVAEIEAREIGEAAELGLFRVWSTIAGDPDQDRLFTDQYPLTDAARTAQAAWDPVRDNPAIRCEPKGLPSIMDPPYPMEFSDQDDRIILRQEEFDTVRTIYMNADTTPAPQRSLLGHSVGHWQGETLVVVTTHMTWPYFDNQGIPQSDQMRLEERFTVSDNGKRLNYTLEATEPAIFTEPVHLDRFWIWMAESQVERYNCTPL